MDYADKIRAFERLGVERVLAQHFSPEFAALEPQDFARQVLVGALAARVVVVGDDFTFGRGRQGQTGDLVALGGALGFAVEVVRRLEVEGMIASSTRIRSFLLQGRVRAAGLLLGRPHTVSGRVASGAGRGRTLGYPTANLATQAELLPARGVYVCHAWRSGWEHGRLAVTSIGTNPTFGAGEQTVETHILDHSEDLVDRPLAVAFRERLRAEVAFGCVEELVAQIGRDVQRARELARAYPQQPSLDPLHGIDLDTEPVSRG
jgi:riboflavin kinase/FMN adenylyltransferase